MRSNRDLILVLVMLVILAFTGCTEDTVVDPPEDEIAEYVGSATCGNCHSDQFNKWEQSGHPYKLTKINGEAPTTLFPDFSGYPNDPVDPPTGYTWADISYTIGGYGWKMRWIDNDGYIVTSGVAGNLVQHNFEDESWATYHTDNEPGTKPYDCGVCHTTGWVDSNDDDAANNQDGLEGMTGTFFAGGVHCEACHGKGSLHASSPSSDNIESRSESALCGECHMRDSEHHIAASSGFIKHHEQFDEWSHSPHNAVGAPGCNECHDPHSSVKYDDIADGEGVLPAASCENCHADRAQVNHAGATCVQCHMPKATKSAIAVNDYVGDLRTHIFSINTDAVGKDEMFTDDGSLVEEDAEGQAEVTLDFACYSCHQDEQGVGGDGTMKTLAELSARALVIHGSTPPALDYVGSDHCGNCHEDHYNRWEQSGHPYKLTKINGEAPTNLFPDFSGFPNDPVDPPTGYTWADISYTIGGYGWKMRWIDNDGYIVTSGVAGNLVQHNFEDESWATYHPDNEPGTKPYDCGVCHTTGWVDSDDGIASNNQDGLEGMTGTFFAGGVHCEQCHGLGSQHAFNPAVYELVNDSSSDLCGECHMRDVDHHIDGSGGFIKHHEQFDEWSHSPHNAVGAPGCNECHDPHSSVKYDDVAAGEGLLPGADCAGCHTDITFIDHPAIPSCVDCHMAKATKSAIAVHDYQGDIKSHIFAINTAAVGKDEMFDVDGHVVEDGTGQAMVTLDFACYSCHKDESGVGGSASTKTLTDLSDRAIGIHTRKVVQK
jgi:predicted CXXCH cytochrome family protein